tara:strand:+ start:538 stop:771 length:234 start_codon:yes stop_codon:yes gene_type:complete
MVKTGEKDASGWGANSGACVEVGKLHTVARHLIEVGSDEVRLTETAQVSVSKIVSQNEDDIRSLANGFSTSAFIFVR